MADSQNLDKKIINARTPYEYFRFSIRVFSRVEASLTTSWYTLSHVIHYQLIAGCSKNLSPTNLKTLNIREVSALASICQNCLPATYKLRQWAKRFRFAFITSTNI